MTGKDDFLPCERTDCAQYGNVNKVCRALWNFDDEYTKKCPFFKTVEQLTAEQKRTEERLKRLGLR